MSKKGRNFLEYGEEDMLKALTAVKMKELSACKAALTYNVPKSTLYDKLSGKTAERRRMGPDPILSKNEEDRIIEWIKKMVRRGLPPKKNDIVISVQNYLNKNKRVTPFKENKPGEKWFKAFLKRNPEVAFRTPERISKARSEIRKEDILNWFQDLRQFLMENSLLHIMDDPKRIFNSDETNVELSPKTGKVIGIRGSRNIYEISPGAEKANLTFMGTFNAAGDIAAPMIIYPYSRCPPKEIVDNIPDHFYVGLSESGWMWAETFYEFIANCFNKWLETNNVTKPVILFVDGHRSHISMEVSNFCDENNIILYVLPPNTSHILQPADVGPYKTFKTLWRNGISEFQKKNFNASVSKKDVAPILNFVLENLKRETIQNGFKTSGLYPFNEENLNYHKCIDFNNKVSIPQCHDKASPDLPSDYKRSLSHILECAEDSLRQKLMNKDSDIDPSLLILWNTICTKAESENMKINSTYLSDTELDESQESNLCISDITEVCLEFSSTKENVSQTQAQIPLPEFPDQTNASVSQPSTSQFSQLTALPNSLITSLPMSQLSASPVSQLTASPVSQITTSPISQLINTLPVSQSTASSFSQSTVISVLQPTVTPLPAHTAFATDRQSSAKAVPEEEIFLTAGQSSTKPIHSQTTFSTVGSSSPQEIPQTNLVTADVSSTVSLSSQPTAEQPSSSHRNVEPIEDPFGNHIFFPGEVKFKRQSRRKTYQCVYRIKHGERIIKKRKKIKVRKRLRKKEKIRKTTGFVSIAKEVGI